MKASGKAIGIIAGTSAIIIGGVTVAANILLQNENGKIEKHNPLNRDKNFHHYSLVNKIGNNKAINDLISIQKDGDNITYIIEENKFVNNIRSIVQEALKSIPSFAQNYLSYTIECNYKINTKSVLVDLVWYEPGSKSKFFDQFEIILQVS